jgi:tryptophan-rich sensory protein
MTTLFQRPTSNSLAFNLLLVVGGVLIVNALIFGFEWSTSSSEQIVASPSFAPPGWIVGAVWTLWFICMAVARWLVIKSESNHGRKARILIDILIISCLLYPFYSLAIGSVIGGLVGNVLTVILTSFVFYRVYDVSKVAAFLIFPIIPWVIFASIITLIESDLL